MMFAQPLLEMWKPEWKFAYTVGLSLGAKFTTEGFYLADIVNHLTDEFTLETLLEGERIACEAYDWLAMNERVRVFRNALLNVALEEPLTASGADPNSLLPPGDEELHVLIVDDSRTVCALHRAMVLGLRPTAHVHTCESVGAAREYLRDCNLKQDYVRLILVDFNLAIPEGDQSCCGSVEPPAILDVLNTPNGFDIAEAWDEGHPVGTPPIDFRFKPLVCMISSHADRVINSVPIQLDGSVRECDVLMPKPLNSNLVRALIEASGI